MIVLALAKARLSLLGGLDVAPRGTVAMSSRAHARGEARIYRISTGRNIRLALLSVLTGR